MQTSVNNPAIAKAGQLADLGFNEVRSYVNASIQKGTITITAADLATVATMNGTAVVFDKQTVTVTSANAATVATVNGTTYTANAAAGTKTKTEISTELVALINAGETLCTAEVVGETTVITNVTSAITVVGTTNCSVAQTAQTTTQIATGLAARINSVISTVTASGSVAVITVVADDPFTTFTAVGTTNCTIGRITDAPAAIPFGVMVCIDPDNNAKCKLPAVAADVTGSRAIGFTRCSQVQVSGEGYDTGDTVPVLKKGNIWVVAEEAVAPGDTVYVRYTENGVGKSQLGAIRNDNDSSTAGALGSAEVLDYDSSTGLALIGINRI